VTVSHSLSCSNFHPFTVLQQPLQVAKAAGSPTVWKVLSPPKVDVQAFESLFTEKVKVKKKVMERKDNDDKTRPRGVVPFSALDPKRAQAVGILMGSLKMGADVVAKAVLAMDESVLDLEQLKAM
jgi:hypothetical protein